NLRNFLFTTTTECRPRSQLELSKKADFLYKHRDSSEKRKLINFVCSNSVWKDHTLAATLLQSFDLLAITNTSWQRERPPELFPAAFKVVAPQVGLEPTTLRLTAECSAIELLRSIWWRSSYSRWLSRKSTGRQT